MNLIFNHFFLFFVFCFLFFDIFALCETNTEDSVDSLKFSVRGYLPLSQRDSGTDERSCSVHVFDCPYFVFILCWLLYSPLGTGFDDISSSIDNSEAIVCGNLNIHHKDWVTYSGRTDRPSKLYRKFCQTT